MNGGAYSLFSSESYDPTLLAECTKLLNAGLITNTWAEEIKKYSAGDLEAGNKVKEVLTLIKMAQSVGYKTGKLKKKPKNDAALPPPSASNSLISTNPAIELKAAAPVAPPLQNPVDPLGQLAKADYSRKPDVFSALSPMPSNQPTQPLQPMQGGRTFRRSYNQNRTLRR